MLRVFSGGGRDPHWQMLPVEAATDRPGAGDQRPSSAADERHGEDAPPAARH